MSDPRGAPTKIGSPPIVIEKHRIDPVSGSEEVSFYACGPVRRNVFEAVGDAGLFGELNVEARQQVAAAEQRGAALAMARVRRMAEERAEDSAVLSATVRAAMREKRTGTSLPLEDRCIALALRDLAATIGAPPDLSEEVRRIEERGAETTKKRIVTELRAYASGAGHTVKAQALYEAADLIEGGA